MRILDAKNLQTLVTGFLAHCPLRCFIRSVLLMMRANFVTVVYEDMCGIKEPVGLIHKITIHGEKREVFTYCCMKDGQPDKALFVRRRTGNRAEDVALSFDDQDLIPSYLKKVPDFYKKGLFKNFSLAG